MKVRLKVIGKMPEFKTKGAVCADAYAHLTEDVLIPINERRLIPLGFACELPCGYELQVRPRSGLSAKGIDATLGTGDWDYTGEYKACLVNNSNDDFVVRNGDRICQIAIRKVPEISFVEVSEIWSTERGDNGFGSTGLK